MPLAAPPVQERRRFVRCSTATRVDISLTEPPRVVTANSVNVSGGGFCLRLQELLEVRSVVQLRLTPDAGGAMQERRPVTCAGRVSWVVQRLDLRDVPPFWYDVGIECVDPPPVLRQFLAQRIGTFAAQKTPRLVKSWCLPTQVRGRLFVPTVEQTTSQPLRWHLVVSVDGAPCLSEHYASERAAAAGWMTFKRRAARR